MGLQADHTRESKSIVSVTSVAPFLQALLCLGVRVCLGAGQVPEDLQMGLGSSCLEGLQRDETGFGM